MFLVVEVEFVPDDKFDLLEVDGQIGGAVLEFGLGEALDEPVMVFIV